MRDDVSLGGLETALEANDGPAAAELVNRALDRAVEAHMGDFLAWHQIVFIEGAQAEARAARARGSWVSGRASAEGGGFSGAMRRNSLETKGSDLMQLSVNPFRLTGARVNLDGLTDVRSNSLTPANSRLSSLTKTPESGSKLNAAEAVELHPAGVKSGGVFGSPPGHSIRSAEDLLSKNSASTLHGTINGREVRAERVESGPDRRGAYWRVYVDGELHSHFRTEAGVQHYAAIALAQEELPKFAFNVADPRSIRWAREQSSRLVTEIMPETRKAVQESISSGIADGIPPRRNARIIRSQVGFRSDQHRMVRNLGAEFDSARPGTVVTRFPPRQGVRKLPGFRVKVPDRAKIGESAYQEWRARQLNRYREMQHRYRARMIARSETIRSANAGQLGQWRQIADTLGPTIKRKWITTVDGRERDSHRERNGEVVGINESWEWGYETGEEVHCRCGQGLVEVEAENQPSRQGIG